MKSKTTEKRLFHYALNYKKTIMIGIVCLMIAVAMELSGPLIAKKVIDDHIVGVANHYVVTDKQTGAIEFNGEHYIRVERYDSIDDEKVVTLFQDGLSFFLLDEEVPLNARFVEGDGYTFVLEVDQTEVTVSGQTLETHELFHFFQPEVSSIAAWLGLYLGLILASSVFLYYKTYLLQYASNRIIQTMRQDVFSHIQRIPIPYFVDQPAGKVVARVTNDTEAIKELYEKVLEVFTSGFIYMFGIFIALFILDARLAAICLVLVPLMVLWMLVYRKIAGHYNHEIRETNSRINANINESIQGMSIIQAYNQVDRMTGEFENLNRYHYRYQRKMNTFTALTSFNLVDFLRNVAFVAFIMYFGGISLDGTGIVTAGVLYAFVDYLTRLFEPVNQIVSQLAQLEQSRVAGKRVFELLDEDGEEVEEKPITRYDGYVEFEQVSFAYEKDDYVLEDLSFSIQPGETAAFVGHTGSGKSTVMNLLFRFYDPSKGRILIDGKPINELSRQQARSHIGIVLQDPFIFTGTIISNITMNDPRVSREDAINALKAVGADRFIEQLPNQYDEPVKEKGAEFSTGQRQLLSFARALAFDPAILILDEATANIDTETEAMIQEALKVLKKGRTTLVIAHRLSTIQDADQIFVLKQGELIEKGTHDSLLQTQGEYYMMYRMQLGGKQAFAT
ncbi:ABC transporter ATP-binding protein [Alkalibacillus haloalkaliphilus]|uniref:Putative multidrug resistance ABC transporter ATP-binding/permease protein YheH n=1 Tax=Alkalibacillus haloalkaliphilus TaxID=94136 RepID=A0A511VZT1_9BACI|nr:ABC transporter ATP-binding protein [Alkalibacillus haloalkaliphilus]GEN44344.1 putative multidrug resistance ABC transporter ATP-binding/permease protein YheH [Alkalibacillus haloalkaliphilus]